MMGRVQYMVAIVVALASTANAAALRENEIYLIRELASELANDLRNQDIVRQTESETKGRSYPIMASFTHFEFQWHQPMSHLGISSSVALKHYVLRLEAHTEYQCCHMVHI